MFYSSCSKTCGVGLQTKRFERKCDNPPPQNGGAVCPGGLLQTNKTSVYCHIKVCKGLYPDNLNYKTSVYCHIKVCKGLYHDSLNY